MKEEWEVKLQEEFPFMKQNHSDDERNVYRRWGCECSRGWYNLLHECCQAITDRYEDAGVPIDFVPAQIKEKFGTLRFYFGYEDAPCGIAAFDFLENGTSIRFEPGNEHDDEAKKKLRRDISSIVRAAEGRSKHTCEMCGVEDTACIRTDLGWVKTLCEKCHSDSVKAIEENKNKCELKAKDIYNEIKNKTDK